MPAPSAASDATSLSGNTLAPAPRQYRGRCGHHAPTQSPILSAEACALLSATSRSVACDSARDRIRLLRAARTEERIDDTAVVHAERARTRSHDRAVVAPVKVAPSGLPSAGPDGPPLTSAPPTRFCREVRPRPVPVLPHSAPSRDIHSTHRVPAPKAPASGTPGESGRLQAFRRSSADQVARP